MEVRKIGSIWRICWRPLSPSSNGSGSAKQADSPFPCVSRFRSYSREPKSTGLRGTLRYGKMTMKPIYKNLILANTWPLVFCPAAYFLMDLPAPAVAGYLLGTLGTLLCACHCVHRSVSRNPHREVIGGQASPARQQRAARLPIQLTRGNERWPNAA